MCEVYRRLAELEKDPVRRQTLVRIMHDERRHCAILKRRTGREMAPDPKRVFWYVWIMRVLGPAFVVRQMELCEKGTEASYSLYAEREEFIRIASEEKRHGEDLTNLAGGMRLSYMSSVVLGLNDALVEFTGALAGLDKFSWEGHCMYCGHCAPCSVGIDIAGVNKYYNLTLAQHEIPETVREHYRLLPHHASECIACGRCERNCPFGVDIIGHMRLAAAKFGY